MEILISLLILTGVFFIMTTAFGLHRLLDVYSRTHVVTKSASLGLATILLASVLVFSAQGESSFKQILVLLFIFFTAPVSAHMITRAAYSIGVPLWDRSIIDELREKALEEIESAQDEG